jgi:TonB family protein
MRASANQQFKDEYPRTIRRSIAIAVPISLLLATLLPHPGAVLPVAGPHVLQLIDLHEMDTPPARRVVVLPRLPVEYVDETVVDVHPEKTPLRTDPIGAPPSPTADDPTLSPYDVAPRPVSMIRPDYPLAARDAGVEGVVTVRMQVDSRGLVERVFVVSSTMTLFERPTLEALRRWRFTPARKAGRAVESSITFSLAFTLIDEADPGP